MSWEIRRQAGEFVVEPYSEEEIDNAIEWANLPPRMPGETLPKWAKRTAIERGVGKLAVRTQDNTIKDKANNNG